MLDDTMPIFLFAVFALAVAAALPVVVRLIAGERNRADDALSTTELLDQDARPQAHASDEFRHVRIAVELIVLQVLAMFLFLWAVAADVGSDHVVGSTEPSDGIAFWMLVVLMTLPIVGIGYARLNGRGRVASTRIEPKSEA